MRRMRGAATENDERARLRCLSTDNDLKMEWNGKELQIVAIASEEGKKTSRIEEPAPSVPDSTTTQQAQEGIAARSLPAATEESPRTRRCCFVGGEDDKAQARRRQEKRGKKAKAEQND